MFGGLIYIIKNFSIKNIFIGIQFEENDYFNDIIKIINEKKINFNILEKGNKLILDNDIYIDVLFPIRKEEIKDNSINNNSLVFKLIYKETSLLFTGDIEKETEEKLVKIYKENLRCNILKVAHHGSKTSSINEFIQYANPEIALIGVGKKNNFGHPNLEVLNRLIKIGCKIYRTDEKGEIVVIINEKGKIKLKTFL